MMQRNASPLPDYEWQPAGPEWTTRGCIIAGKKCRQKGCERPAVAALNRGQRRPGGGREDMWWCYCGKTEHLYGQRVVEGVVMARRRRS